MKPARHFFVPAVLVAFVIGAAGCAALKNLRTSREVIVNNPPYYHGRAPGGSALSVSAGYLPVTTDYRIRREFDDAGWRVILDDIDEFLQETGWARPLPAPDLPDAAAPDIYVGSPGMMGAPVSETGYMDEDDDILPMVLYTRDGSREWKTEIGRICSENQCDYVLVLYLGISQYMVHQRGILGGKEIALGTGHRIPVKWLTSLEDPVEVIHLTGLLIDKEGNIINAGAEGLLAAKTASFFQSIIGLRNAISDKSISGITTDIRRDDLDGDPLAYQVALGNLFGTLLGRKELIRK
ncbi:hypothetical protein JXO52_14805 [bacterium]|nr:hypothetical protein [bacterium]